MTSNFVKLHDEAISVIHPELAAVMNGETLPSSVYDAVSNINEYVLVDTENQKSFIDNKEHMPQVVSVALHRIRTSTPAKFMLKLIELYHLDQCFELDETIKELQTEIEAA
ncbi:hypothetical protein AB3A98_002748 [Vibrio parahaemolyticus]